MFFAFFAGAMTSTSSVDVSNTDKNVNTVSASDAGVASNAFNSVPVIFPAPAAVFPAPLVRGVRRGGRRPRGRGRGGGRGGGPLRGGARKRRYDEDADYIPGADFMDPAAASVAPDTAPAEGDPEQSYFDRKAHAIGLLASRILARLPDTLNPELSESWEVCVDDVIAELRCPKGAAYEVFHVLESLLLATKIGRSTYRWNG